VTPPRLLHVFATFTAAGPQVRTAQLMTALGDEFAHAVIAMDGRVDARELLPPGFPLEVLPPPPPAGSARTALRMRRRLEELAPDLVLTYNWGAVDTVLAVRAGPRRPLIHHEDGFRPDEAVRRKPHRALFRRLVLPAAHRVVVISRTLQEVALREWHLPPAQVAYVPNGIRASEFPLRDGNAELRASLGIPTEAVVVGAVGHLRPEKNVARLLWAVERAAERAPDADLHVLLLGDGPERARLETHAARPALAGRVHFAGYHADPRPFYRAMDVFALSSDTEQMPIALLEAMAAGLPAAGTDVGDVRAMLPDVDRHRVVPCRRGVVACPELAEALAELVADPGLRAAAGTRNRARVEAEYDEARMVATYRELYLAALGSRAAAASRAPA
jgi:glycosyltransferase involved in cell wall biosynthesis